MVPLMYHVSHGESSLGFSYRVRIVRYPMAKIGLSSQSSNDRSLGSIGSAGSFTPFLDYGLGMQSIAQSEKSVDSSKTRCGLPWTYGQELDCDTVTIAYRTTTAKPRFRQLSPRVAYHRTPKNGNARSFGLIALRTPRLPRFTFCATAEIET